MLLAVSSVLRGVNCHAKRANGRTSEAARQSAVSRAPMRPRSALIDPCPPARRRGRGGPA